MTTKANRNMNLKHGKQLGRKRKNSKLLEEDISKAEAILLDENHQPQSEEDFEKFVFQSPVSSVAWLGYAAFLLSRQETAAARCVMERALLRIPFTEQKEVQNIWFSYVTLESTYGGSDSLRRILERFMRHNDTLTALDHLLKVFERCQKLEDAATIGETMIKKFKYMPEAWISYGNFLYSTGKMDEARQLLQKSSAYLDKQQQITATIQFAKAEFRNGSVGEGVLLFEKLVSAYPKRTDLWSVYVDSVAKSGDRAQAVELFERILSLNIREKQMHFITKKYQDFKNKNT